MTQETKKKSVMKELGQCKQNTWPNQKEVKCSKHRRKSERANHPGNRGEM